MNKTLTIIGTSIIWIVIILSINLFYIAPQRISDFNYGFESAKNIYDQQYKESSYSEIGTNVILDYFIENSNTSLAVWSKNRTLMKNTDNWEIVNKLNALILTNKNLTGWSHYYVGKEGYYINYNNVEDIIWINETSHILSEVKE